MRKLIFTAIAVALLVGLAAIPAQALCVTIDIKPWSCPNSINLNNQGVVPVAIITNTWIDATTVDPDTVTFAGAEPVQWALEDVDLDGDMDMILHFNTSDLDLECGDTCADLDGSTMSGTPIHGTDSVRIICNNN